MINISKYSQPGTLIKYKSTSKAKFDGPGFTETKKEIRTNLLKEQGFLCAYCMVSLEDDPLKTKIEHWHSQKKYSSEDLVYKNMLAVCLGNSNSETHCDTAKSKYDLIGKRDLHFNPSNPQHDMNHLVRYLANGEIKGDEDFTEDIEVLNLNASRLKNDRAKIWEAVTQGLATKDGDRNKIQLQKILDQWKDKSGGRLKAYCGVAIYYLNRRLERAN